MTHHHRYSLTILSIVVILALVQTLSAQTRVRPQWWFGGAVGANVNWFSTDIKNLNTSVPAISSAFTKGSGVGLFLSPLLEYRHDETWGGILHLGFDSRNGSFTNNASGSLSTIMNYISLEPSVRVNPFESEFYLFAGPRIGFNVGKSFTYTPAGGSEIKGDWSGIRSVVLGFQLGAGYDFDLSSPSSDWQTLLSPFAALHVGQGPRSEEKWSLFTLRLGLALKFGSASEAVSQLQKDLQFSVRAPRIIPTARKIRETFPMRNYVFFDEGSTSIPPRYVKLSKPEAGTFAEENLLEPEPKDLTGRSRRQMTTYHNILNILGDRMRRNPNITMTLTGSASEGPEVGRSLAEAVRSYLVDVFGVEVQRIAIEGRARPGVPSAAPGGTRELELVRPEDRRVEVTSSDPALLDPVKIVSLQEDPLESDVIVSLAGASDVLVSWNVEVTDEQGRAQRFGPYTQDQERIPGRTILGDLREGTYKVVVLGQTRSGQTYRNEQTIRMAKSDLPEEEPGLRFSILFEFDQSKTVATYERFLTGTVAPLVPENGSVIIHGHTDIVGEESHNLSLSRDRAQETMRIIDRELTRLGRKGVKFDTYGFGEDIRRAAFENKYPEERFYNRTVIIDILPE